MKTLVLLAACLGTAALSHAQTTPTAPAAGTTPAVSGTKNVGSDRADAPKAPGMSTPGPTPSAPARPRRAASRRGPATPPKAPAAPATAQ
ncbi:hypothetical protein FNT36_09310 [Hymenobacter setariae]|uniref:Uncharacterized protein n=1 Tax=Hymenobacter setariae TaxID=2594794 RepID=A0A558BYL5_9BACT|nr:hypothetical protein [Hymenobacter setariae]TVT41620.1 hypothetical protein FNT36_09310 [Hymenobacter setariae]